NRHDRASIEAEIIRLNIAGNIELAARAALVAQFPAFTWISDITTVNTSSGTSKLRLQTRNRQGRNRLKVCNLPDRGCSAKVSDRELHFSDAARYEAYVKAVASQLRRYPDVSVAIALEPDSIGNLVTNLSVPKCSTSTRVPPRPGSGATPAP
ncbi:unnamed protein product, partial [Rhizoctonia solani]